jgi:hypothetical protein
MPSAVWNAIKNEDIHVDGHWDDDWLHAQEDDDGGVKWYLGEDHSPQLACPMSTDDWSLIKGGTLEGSYTITVGENSYHIHLERDTSESSNVAIAKVRLVA